MKLKNRLRRVAPGLAIVIAACSNPSDAPRAAADADYGEPQTGGAAVVAIGADMSIPIAIVAQTAVDGNLGGDVMFMALLATDWEDGRLTYKTADESPMAIARSYEYLGQDSSSLRFNMRSDLAWSDGVPLTADDVVFTYDILGEEDLASPLQHYAENIESVEAENDSTVVFHFVRRYPEMLTHSAVQPVPAHIFDGTPAAEFRNHPAIRNPESGRLVVSGPYQIGSWERGTRIVLERNPEFAPSGHLDQVVFRVIPDPITRIVELQTNAVDVVPGITFDQVSLLRERAPNVRLEHEEKRFYDFIAYNGAEFEPFADSDIRRALGLTIDVQGIIEALQMEEFAEQAGGPYAPIFRDLYDPVGQAPLEYDPDEAGRLLAEKGWRDSDADGILDKDGRRFSFTLVTNSGNQRRADASQIIQEQWRRVGIHTEIQIREFNTMMADLTGGEYQAVLGGWGVALSPSLEDLWAPDAPFNVTRYRNPQVTDLIEEAGLQTTADESLPIWREAASRIAGDQPYTWLYYMDSIDGVNNRLRATEIDTYGPYQNVWEWWIPEQFRR